MKKQILNLLIIIVLCQVSFQVMEMRRRHRKHKMKAKTNRRTKRKSKNFTKNDNLDEQNEQGVRIGPCKNMHLVSDKEQKCLYQFDKEEVNHDLQHCVKYISKLQEHLPLLCQGDEHFNHQEHEILNANEESVEITVALGGNSNCPEVGNFCLKGGLGEDQLFNYREDRRMRRKRNKNKNRDRT